MQFKDKYLCDYCFEPIKAGSVCPKCGLSADNYVADVQLLQPGTNLLGKYIIGRVLGRGGFGATYLAYSSTLKRSVAIKEFFPLNLAYRTSNAKIDVLEEKRESFNNGLARFYEEAKILFKFDVYDTVVSVYEFFYANNTAYYAMEYLEGLDLGKYLASKGGILPENEAISIIKKVCLALKDIHSAYELHKDISPDNIFVCSTGKIKLLDFGATVEGSTKKTIVLKPGFAAPEQYQSETLGPWTDIYSVGATLYYILTSKMPPEATDRIRDSELAYESNEYPSMAIRGIIKECMEYDYNDRFPNISCLLSEIELLGIEDILVNEKDETEYVGETYEASSAEIIQKAKTNFAENFKRIFSNKKVRIATVVGLMVLSLVSAILVFMYYGLTYEPIDKTLPSGGGGASYSDTTVHTPAKKPDDNIEKSSEDTGNAEHITEDRTESKTDTQKQNNSGGNKKTETNSESQQPQSQQIQPQQPQPQPQPMPEPRPAPKPMAPPKTEAPKTEAPKTDPPKTEAPKTEAPKTEAPKIEVQTQAPVRQVEDAPEVWG